MPVIQPPPDAPVVTAADIAVSALIISQIADAMHASVPFDDLVNDPPLDIATMQKHCTRLQYHCDRLAADLHIHRNTTAA